MSETAQQQGGRLGGKIALVTGGSRGIGAAVARAFAREGASVVIASRKQDGLDATAAEINADYPGRVHPKACHVGRVGQITELIDWIEAELGPVDVLVNNAGTNPHFGPMLTATEGMWNKTFDINLRGAFELTREVVQRLQKAGRPGSIINMTSVLGQGAAPLQGVYGMTKAALISMTQTLSVELGPANIRVNAIAPGLIATRFSKILIETPDILERFTSRTALGRHGEPPEIAGAAVFLASDESSYVTGQTFSIDGGYTIT
ncbi:MAG: short-chain dehydrogenase [Myxococcales bacterium]|nr:short-chain dehydrogenase [Myxococcales bacterium]